MPLEEGIALMKKGFKEINTRFMIGGATFTLKVFHFLFLALAPVLLLPTPTRVLLPVKKQH